MSSLSGGACFFVFNHNSWDEHIVIWKINWWKLYLNVDMLVVCYYNHDNCRVRRLLSHYQWWAICWNDHLLMGSVFCIIIHSCSCQFSAYVVIIIKSLHFTSKTPNPKRTAKKCSKNDREKILNIDGTKKTRIIKRQLVYDHKPKNL